MIQKIRIANFKSRFNRTRAFIRRAINQPGHSRLYQSAGAHYAGFDGRINYGACQSIVADSNRCLAKRNDLGMSGWILIRARSISGDGQYRFAGNDASADGDLAKHARVISRRERLTHPVCIRLSFFGGSHDRNILVKQRKIEL
jgi:hypothetical protein